ncbi:AsmA family protein [Solilutibacter silvestris]|uniref:AsmA-type protein n=1 Tax=Solilutibacter silvestris TaxID=1645665 RepID=A0A2K1PXK7_9GAMM|nr:AsmA family protein [Lysobacter silvestris]PNS07427.1 AsmA-type protein [Lysobacter silvestris]
MKPDVHPVDDMRPEDRAPVRSYVWIRRHPLWTVFGILTVAIIILILLWDWNWFKRPIERYVHDKTGRELHIDGNLGVHLGRLTTVTADGLRFGNAAWSKTPLMVKTDRLQMSFELWPALFARDFRIPDLRLVHPDLLLETGPDGIGNWVLKNSDARGMQPQFQRLWIDGGRLRYVDAPVGTDVDIAVQTAAPQSSTTGPPIDVKGSGHWKGSPFALQGHGESPLDLRDRNRPYQVDAHAVAGPTRAHARGTLLDPLRMRDFNLQLALSGSNLDDLYRLLGIALPPTPPYALDGRLTRVVNSPTSSTWKYDGFSGRVGNSDLAGFAHFTTGNRHYLQADLRSKQLDLEDLAGFIGGAPKAGHESNGELAAKAARQQARGKLFPDDPFNTGKLRSMDADVRLRAAQINTQTLPVDDMDAVLALKGGVLTLHPLDFGVADGLIRSDIRMDARKDILHTQAEIHARDLTLAKLLPKVKLGNTAIGKLGGNATINGTGNSIAAILGSADGGIDLGMGQGQISKLAMAFAGLDLASILKIKLTRDQQIPIRCAFGDFAIRDGIASPRALAFDTSDLLMTGAGQIDMKNERLDLTLQTKPRRFSPLSLRAPLYIRGSFVHASVRPDYARVGLRALAATALGSLTAPAAALVATTNLGGKAEAYCGAAR